MTLVRIDPSEMMTASKEFEAESNVIGEAVTGARAQCTNCCMPPAVASQLEGSLTTLEQSLTDIRTELLLEAIILVTRAIMVAKGSETAGELVPGPIPTPVASFADVPSAPAAGGSTTGGGLTLGDLKAQGFTDTQIARIVGLEPSSVFDIPDVKNPFLDPEPNDFNSWANSSTRDTDHDGVRNNMDVNPGRYDTEYTDHDSSTKPHDY